MAAISFVLLREETRIPLEQVRVETNVGVYRRTIRRRLREAGIRKWKTVFDRY